MALINQYSFVIFAALGGLALAAGLWRWQGAPRLLRIGLLVLYVIAALAFGTSRQYPAGAVTTLAEADAVLANERPTFVMLYSNY